MAPAAQPLDSFKYFPNLPVEIRFKIWKYAIPGPRLIALTPDDPSPRRASFKWHIDPNNFTPETLRYSRSDIQHHILRRWHERPAPEVSALLITCHESRQVALKGYDFCFSTSIYPTIVITETMHYRPCETRIVPNSKVQPPRERIVPHSEILSRGCRFQPARDTIYLTSSYSYVGSLLNSLKHSEVKMVNIQSLAIPIGACYALFNSPPLDGLTELFLVALEDDEAKAQARVGITQARIMVDDIFVRWSRRPEGIHRCGVKPVTEAMLMECLDSSR